MRKKTLIIIPARLGSTRLPKKMLLDKTGKPLICHTYEQAQKAKADKIIVATDDKKILEAVKDFGGEAELTKISHQSGTDRIAEVARRHSDYEIIINLQGDEPEIEPTAINQLIELQKKYHPFISTLCCPFPNEKISAHGSPLDPACVKVVLGAPPTKKAPAYYAIYFSRSPIPYPKVTNGTIVSPRNYYLHLGIYAYTASSLKKFTSLPKSFLEETEELEQLRALESGYQILVGKVQRVFPGINTADDYQAFLKRWQQKKEK